MRAVVTGIAPVAAIGVGREEFFRNLYLKNYNVKKADDDFLCAYNSRSKWYVPYPRKIFTEYSGYVKKLKGRAPCNAIAATLAAELAAEDAGLPYPGIDASVVMGVGVLNTTEMLTASESVIGNKIFFPLTITQIIPNSAAAWISISMGLHGPANTVSTACASGTTAVGQAYRLIKDGYCKAVFAGGTECLIDDRALTFRGFDSIGALTGAEDGRPCPFGKNRSGFLFSEGGACVLLLEELETALERSAHIYAEIVDYSECSDAYHIVMMPEDPVQIKSRMDRIFAEYDIGYYNAHGTATPMNDKTEAAILKEVSDKYGRRPVINSTKGITGHNLGASGAIEAAVCAYALKNGTIHGNLMDEPDENMAGLDIPMLAPGDSSHE